MTNPKPQYLDEASLMLDDEITGPRLTRVAIALEGRDKRYKELEFKYNVEKSRVRHLLDKLARKSAQLLLKGTIVDHEPTKSTDAGG